MFDIWVNEIELTSLTMIFSVAVLFPLQLIFCFKVKNLFLRLLPVLLTAALTLFWILMAVFDQTEWNGLGYIIFAMFSGFALLTVALAWLVWVLVWLVKKKKEIK